MKKTKKILGLASSIALIASLSVGTPAANAAWSLSEAAKPYKGVTITVSQTLSGSVILVLLVGWFR